MKRKQGFTLIELLAVIIILAVIALIATSLILGVIERTQKSAYEASLRNVFSATELYIARSDFIDFPEEGIDVQSTNIQIKNKDFTMGKILRNEAGEFELDKVSNGKFCGSGTLNNLTVIEGGCELLDTTPPTLSVASSTITSRSITIVATAEDLESGISRYEFSKDNGVTWTSKQVSNIYTFDNLINNTNYTFKVRVENNNKLTSLSEELIISTNDIPIPTYSIDNSDWTSNPVVVTITYPEKQPGYIYEYSLDGAATWEEVEGTAVTKDITFTNNGSVIARISDGTNIVSGTTYEVTNIDNTSPIINVEPTEVMTFIGSVYTNEGVTATDDMLGDITSEIIVTGNVDTSVEGTYTLTYNVSDLAGNAATEVTRTVTVIHSTYSFTNAGQSGRTGPSQSQIDSSYTGTSLAGKVTVSGGIQQWTVPYTGTYRIEANGAQGGRHLWSGNYGGKGARIIGEFQLQAGEILNILVGQAGENARSYDNAGPGGGGGTYIYKNATDTYPLIAAGGGGGGGRNGSGYNGTTSTSGTNGESTSSNAVGGTNGNGGASPTDGSSYWSGGGAGWLSDGSGGQRGTSRVYTGSSSRDGQGGRSPKNGGYGGTHGTDGNDEGGNGGFGGGAGGTDDNGGTGGGGGYSGGAGANSTPSNARGGGGGSYNAGTNQSNTAGVKTGHGQVIITIIE